MIPYTSLRAFQKVVQLGSLKAAAESLHLTESAISHQLKNLEQHLDAQLFYKEGRALRATPKGKELADRLSAPFDDIDYALTEFKQQTKTALSIYCIPSLIHDWLMPRLVAFNQHAPEMSVSLKYLQSLPAHIDEHAICIKSMERHEKPRYPYQVIMAGETVPVCSPLYLAQHGAIHLPSNLLHATLLHDQNTQSWDDWLLRSNLVQQQHARHVFEDFYLLKFAAMAAQGVALCPIHLIQTELKEGKLIQLFEEPGNLGRQYVLEHNARPSLATRTLIQFLFESET